MRSFTRQGTRSSPRLPRPPGGVQASGRQLGHRRVGDALRAPRRRPAWLSRRLDFARPEDFVEESAVSLLYVVRRYAGKKLLYELELHGDVEVESMRSRYVELLHDATKIEPAPADYLADVDDGFYCTCYLRAWAFHTQIESHLREELGRAWFHAPRPVRSSGSSGPRVSGSRRPSCSTRWQGRRSSWPRWASESKRRWGCESKESRHRRRRRPRLPQLQRRLQGAGRRPGGRLHGDANPDIEGRVYPAALAGSRYRREFRSSRRSSWPTSFGASRWTRSSSRTRT